MFLPYGLRFACLSRKPLCAEKMPLPSDVFGCDSTPHTDALKPVTILSVAPATALNSDCECVRDGFVQTWEAYVNEKPLRIVIADDEPIIRLDLKKMLEDCGYDVVAEVGDGARAVEFARNLKPDVVILDIKMPELDGIDAAKLITDEKIAPVLLLTAYSQLDLVNRAKEAGVFSYLVKPFKEADLMPQIEVTVARWEAFLKIEEQAADMEDKLETRKAVDRAKGILMDQYGLKEQEAFRRIQVQSMNTRKSMREIAEAIIIAHNV
jgi:response regulator NasT